MTDDDVPPISGLDETIAALDATVDAGQLRLDGLSRVEPAAVSGDTAERHALDALARLTEQRTAPPVTLGATLGEGGMGVVRLGVQPEMGRTVAVKTVRDGVAISRRATLAMLHEAWITGALEHPDIVPVYTVSVDADGRPVIVMKRVEGTPWSELTCDPDAVRARFEAEDVIEWHLRTLLRVCHALEYAHARGFVHRDVKPSNVMVGRFGEVYLMDWGIAVALEDDESGRFPLARDALQLAGTPGYMAPEMLGGAWAQPPTPQTDVYLLGATLYDILVGRPPHRGTTLTEVVRATVVSEPAVPDTVPPDLADLVRAAMKRRPKDRLPDVATFARCVEQHLRRRGAARLADEAEARRRRLEASLATEPDRGEVYDLLGACRFGFEQALAAWPDHAAARRGLDAAHLAVARFELARGDAAAASALLQSVAAPPGDLARAVEEALARAEAARERLAALEKALDPASGQSAIRWYLLVPILVGVLGPLVEMYLDAQPGGGATHARNIGRMGSLLVVTGAATWWLYRRGVQSFHARGLAAAGVGVFTALLLISLLGARFGLDPVVTQALFLPVGFVAVGLFAFLARVRLWPALLAWLVGLAAVAYDFSLLLPAVAWCNLTLGLNVWFAGRRFVLEAPQRRERPR